MKMRSRCPLEVGNDGLRGGASHIDFCRPHLYNGIERSRRPWCADGDKLVSLICFASCGSIVALIYSPWAEGAEWAETLPAAALLAAVLGIAIPLYRRDERAAKAKGAELVRLERADVPPFLESDEGSEVYGLPGYHSNRRLGKAFGFVPHDLYGDLYLTPERIVYMVQNDPEPALSIPLERVVAIHRVKFSRRPLRLRFNDETGHEVAWHFGRECGRAEDHIRAHSWIEIARKLVEKAKR